MRVTKAEFVTSAARLSQAPPPSLPEVAFAGRSNVGKSSLINTLVMRKGLVKTSSTPGKTRMLNFFEVNEEYGFVDLPGYGFAKGSKGQRAGWGPLIEGYLMERPTLRAVVLIMDVRHEPFPADLQLAEWLDHQGLPTIFVATKADKLGRARQAEQRKKMAEALGFATEEIILFSAKTRHGRPQLWRAIKAACAEGDEG
jgi:GTP-binding protein